MEKQVEALIKRLWLTYRLYHKVSCRNGSCDQEYATKCTDGYIQYLRECTQEYPYYQWGDWSDAIKNQIRIVTGFIEVYDRPVIRDKRVLKTRWSL